MTWSRQSRRIEPISLSQYPFYHGRREILWIGTTAHPNAEWIARQLTEAFGWEEAPRYIIRDRDRTYGDIVVRRLRAMGHSGSSNLAAVAMAEWIL